MRASTSVIRPYGAYSPHQLRNITTESGGATCRTNLVGLLSRLERALSASSDFNVLSSVLVGVLAGVDSPDAVENVIDRVAECVAPLDVVAAGGGDVGATSAVLTRQSVLGVFVRRFLLATSRLLFDGLSRLFDDVQQYLQQFREDCDLERRSAVQQGAATPTWNEGELLLSPIRVGFSSIAEDTPASSASSLESVSSPPLPTSSFQSPNLVAPTPFRPGDAGGLPKDTSDAAVWSSEQLDMILNDAMQRIRKGASQRDCSDSDRDSATELPGSVHIARALASQGDASDRNALYVKYLDHLHSRDYQGALHALHQYHDVIPADYSRDRALLTGVVGVDAQRTHLPNVSATHFRGTGVQYAALNLAGLQIVFDHYDAAQESLLEAIRVAQHHGDHVCVAFSLSWMVQIAQKLGKPKHDVLPLVKNCMERAKELYLPTLSVLSALADIEVELTRGSSESPLGSHVTRASTQLLPHVFVTQSPGPRPAEVWIQLEQSAQDAVSLFVSASSFSGQGPSANGGRAGAAMLQHAQQQASASGGASGNGADQHSRGMTWARSGDAVLNAMWQMRGNVHLSSAVAWRLFGNRPLEQVFSRLFTACYRDVASLEEMTAAVSRMALHSLSDTTKGSGNGGNVYLRSLQFVVDAVDQLTDQSARKQWIRQASFQRMVHHLLFLLALRRGEYPLASAHLDVVQHLSPAEKNLPANIEAQLNRAILLAEIGDCERSLLLLKALETKCKQLELVYLLAQVMLVTGKVQLRWSTPHASGAALPSVLKCIDVCEQHHYDLLLSEAHLVMAELLLSMGKAHEAQALVRDEMPLVMEHGTVHLRGEAMLLLAKAELSDLTKHSGSRPSVHAAVEHVLKLLVDSDDVFAASQDVKRLVEVNYLKALVYNHALALGISSLNEMGTKAIEDGREDASKQFIQYQHRLNQAQSATLGSTTSFESVEDIRNVLALRSRDH